MKSAYELAMERLNKTAPSTKLNTAQKAEIAELESRCKARIAEREIALKREINMAAHAGDLEKSHELEQQLINERKKLQSDLEDRKEAVRQRKS